jgi:hypothetical protein
MRRVVTLGLFVLAFFLAGTGTARAHDCSDPADTRRCNAAINSVAAAAAVAAGAGAAGVAIGSRSSPDAPPDRKSAAECADAIAQFRAAQRAWRSAKEALDTSLQEANAADYATVEARRQQLRSMIQDQRQSIAQGESEWAEEVANLESLHWQLASVVGATAYLAWIAAAAAFSKLATGATLSRLRGMALGAMLYARLAATWGWETLMKGAAALGYAESTAARIKVLLSGLSWALNTAVANARSMLTFLAGAAVATWDSIKSVASEPFEAYYRAMESLIRAHRDALDAQIGLVGRMEAGLAQVEALARDIGRKDAEERRLREEAKALKQALVGCEGMEHVLNEEPN